MSGTPDARNEGRGVSRRRGYRADFITNAMNNSMLPDTVRKLYPDGDFSIRVFVKFLSCKPPPATVATVGDRCRAG